MDAYSVIFVLAVFWLVSDNNKLVINYYTYFFIYIRSEGCVVCAEWAWEFRVGGRKERKERKRIEMEKGGLGEWRKGEGRKGRRFFWWSPGRKSYPLSCVLCSFLHASPLGGGGGSPY